MTQQLAASDPGFGPAVLSSDPQISPTSKYGDDVWHLEINTAGRRPDQNYIRWALRLPDGSSLTDSQHAELLEAAKRYLWVRLTKPLPGRRSLRPATVISRSRHLFVLIKWMNSQGLYRFSQITKTDVGAFISHMRDRPGNNGGKLTTHTLSAYATFLKDMFLHRGHLLDTISFDPFPTESTFEVAGHSRAKSNSIPFIPDPIAAHLLADAIDWVENKSSAIIAAIEIASAIYNREHSSSFHINKLADAISAAGLPSFPGAGTYRKRDIGRLERMLVAACYVTIAGLVGMRCSEVLSLEVGAVTRKRIGQSSEFQAYVNGRIFKTSSDRDGSPASWVAPSPVCKAIEVLEFISQGRRKAAASERLFLVYYERSLPPRPVTSHLLTQWLHQFAAASAPPHQLGRPWRLSTHQFRKTFARFVARQDRAQLLGLSEHFKHVSIAMTAQGYVGSDYDLYELVNEERRSETAVALEAMLTSTVLGGKLGERLVARNAAYRGRAGEQVRRDYLDFVLKETDLTVHSCEYGWCVFQAETSKCQGATAPNHLERTTSVCLSCANFVMDERHRTYWQSRRDRHELMLDEARPLANEIALRAISECDGVLAALSSTTGAYEA